MKENSLVKEEARRKAKMAESQKAQERLDHLTARLAAASSKRQSLLDAESRRAAAKILAARRVAAAMRQMRVDELAAARERLVGRVEKAAVRRAAAMGRRGGCRGRGHVRCGAAGAAGAAGAGGAVVAGGLAVGGGGVMHKKPVKWDAVQRQLAR